MFKSPLLSSVVCMALASVFGAVGQYLYKEGAQRTGGGLLALLASPWILAGVACYVAVMVLFTQAFRGGGTVTLLYPIYASTFIWAAVIGMMFYGQPIRAVHVLGMILLIGGMYLMGLGNAPPP